MFSNIESIRQLYSGECGAVCLAVVKKIISNESILAELREKSFSSAEGWNLLQFKAAAQEFGLSPNVKYSETVLTKHNKFPIVVHWNFNHFVVLLKVKSNKYTLFDPALGVIIINKEEFSSSFTGFYVEFSNEKTFQRKISTKTIRNISSLNNNFFSISIIILATFIAAFTNILISIFPGIYIHSIFGKYPKLIILPISFLFLIIIIIRLFIFKWLEETKTILTNREASRSRKEILAQLFNKSTSLIQSTEFEMMSMALQKNIAFSGLLIKSKLEMLLSSIILILASFITFALDLRLFFLLVLSMTSTIIFNYYNIETLKSDNNKLTGLIKWSSSVLHENLKFVGILESSNIVEKRNDIWENRDDDQRMLSSGIRLRSYYGDLTLDAIKSVFILTFYVVNVYNVYSGKYSWPVLISLSGIMALSYDSASKLAKYIQETLRLTLEIKSFELFFDVDLTRLKQNDSAIISNDEIVKISGLSFQYHRFGKTILENLDFFIKRGSKVCLSGKSGCGKSTLVKLLSGSYPAYNKNIAWNNTCKKQDRLFLSQIPSIFAGSIKENISCYSDEVSEDTIWQALKNVELDVVVKNLPMGLETIISQDAPLSSGQTQRIALARAFVLQPKFIVIDEATAFLDIETEERILKRIFNICDSILYIGHKPEVIKLMDVVYKLHEGKCLKQNFEINL